MITTGWQSPTSQDPNHEGNSLARALLFCTSRARRGGFRIVLQIAAVLLTIFILFGLLPERMGGGLSNYKDILTWSAEPEQQIANLRIVVFGSPDVAGSAVDEDHVRTTWTEELCRQMNCTSHISYVPGGESNHGMVSNPAYAHEVTALDRVTGSTNITDKPALDYNFINEQYPVPTGTPDLADQIKTFLATPPADAVPHETLWIFTFGTWEVWNLAALPLETAEGLIDTMVLDIFAQIEHLYKHALYPDSVAFSDFWSNATDSQIDELTAPNADSKVDDRKLESFRVLIPKLFDITLTPGWRGRAVPPFPNTEAEQTRNAVWLTRHWNEAMDLAFSAWKDKRAQRPDGVIEDTDEHVVQRREEESGSFRPKSLFDYLPAYMRSKSLNATQAAAERVINAPYPLRNGIQVNTAKVILDAMTEEEMQRSEVRDSQGRGTMGVNDTMRFLDVWTPCVRATTDDLTVDMDEVTEECSIPHDHLFYDAFTIGQRAIVGVTEPILESVLEHLFVRQPKSSWFY